MLRTVLFTPASKILSSVLRIVFGPRFGKIDRLQYDSKNCMRTCINKLFCEDYCVNDDKKNILLCQ